MTVFEANLRFTADVLFIFCFGTVSRSSVCRSARNFALSGELWFSNFGDLEVESNPPKSTSSKNHTLAPTGCCAAKFLHALENDQVLLVHPATEVGVLLTIFSKGIKNWLKI